MGLLSTWQVLNGAVTITLITVTVEWGLPWTPGLAVWPGHAAGRGHSGHCPDCRAQL